MEKPLLSIVVPVYNVQAYLQETVESVVSQMTQLDSPCELLLVDDGSTDSSGELCDDYARAYPQLIRVIHKPNEGLLMTRRCGFRQARGEYIVNCDSDDTLEPDALKTLEAAILRTGADVILFNMNTWIGNSKQPFSQNIFTQGDFCTPTREAVYRAFFTDAGAVSLCGKIFRRSCLQLDKDYSGFPKRSYGEDTIQSAEIYTNARTFAYCNKQLYNYRCDSGMTGKFNPDYFAEFRAVYLALAEYKQHWQLKDFDVLFAGKVFGSVARAITQCRYTASMTGKERIAYLKRLRKDPLVMQCAPLYPQVRDTMKRSYRVLLDALLKEQYGMISALLQVRNTAEEIKQWRFFGLSAVELLLVLSLILAFSEVPNAVAYTPLLFWCMLAFGKAVLNSRFVVRRWPELRQWLNDVGLQGRNRSSIDRVLTCFLRYNSGSQLLIYAYTVALILFGLTEQRFLSTNAMTFINGVSAISVIYLFGRRSIRCSFVALCCAWVVGLFRGFLFPERGSFWVSMEMHDLAFGAGYILLYYLFVHRKWTLKSVACFGVLLLAVLFAFKRIGLAGLAVTVVIWVVLRFLPTDRSRRILLRWGSVAVIAVCYLFVAIFLTGWGASLLESVGINTMGRNYYYAVLAQRCEFSPWFLGLGRNASATLFATDYSYLKVGNVHSDILRMYAECGFVLFGIWLCIYWLALPRAVEKRFGYKAMEFYLLCTAYTFVVYSTDNTELYVVNQYFYLMMIIYAAQLGNRKAAPLEQWTQTLSAAVWKKATARRAQRALQEQHWDEQETEIGYLEHTDTIAEEPNLPQTEDFPKIDLPVQEEKLTEEPILPQASDFQQTLTDENLDELMEKYLVELGYEPPGEE